VTVDPSAPVGGRPIVFSNGDQLAAFTGAVRVVSSATVVSTPTPTPTATQPPTVTASPTTVSPVITATPTATLSPTTPVATRTPGGCVGDCDGSHKVGVDELVKGVNIALGNGVVADCRAFDSDDNDRVTVEELVQGVNAALNGCPT